MKSEFTKEQKRLKGLIEYYMREIAVTPADNLFRFLLLKRKLQKYVEEYKKTL